MILRLIAFAAAVFLAYRVIRWALDTLLPRQPASGPGPAPDQPIVPCKACGTFIPRDQALTDDRDQIFCSSECREKEPG